MKNDEQLPIGVYLRETFRTADGAAWLITCVLSFLCLFDVIFGLNVIPFPALHQGKVIVLLLFSPLLVFLILVRLRQLPLGSYRLSMWIRAGICVVTFFIINFGGYL